MGRDTLSSWLRSVQEAKQHQHIFHATLCKAAKRFFIPKSWNPECTGGRNRASMVVATTEEPIVSNPTSPSSTPDTPLSREADFDPG